MKRIISLTLISALIFSLCSCSTAGAEETYTETVSAETAIIEHSEVETTEASESSMETEQYDDIESYFIVETTSYTNPFSPSTMAPDVYNAICNEVVAPSNFDWSLIYGFDNEYSINELRNQINNYTGSNDSTSTLSDVSYFQGTSRMVEIVPNTSFSEQFSGLMSPYTLAYVRAIMQINGWRFGIDEIPYDYICQRFPGFMQSINEIHDLPYPIQDPNDPQLESVVDPIAFNNMYDYDYVMFSAVCMYNYARLSYIYNAPFGNPDNLTDDVLQVRDAETGRNVLVPTEEQYYQMMEDITSIPGCENVDIRFVETRENFYEAYGYYPEDIINDTMIYEGNISN